MKQTLLNLFKPYRPVKEITAHENTRMRGQAFVTFPDVEIANKARREVGEFPLYGKPIVSHESESCLQRLAIAFQGTSIHNGRC